MLFDSLSISRILYPAKGGTIVIYLGPRLLSGSSVSPSFRFFKRKLNSDLHQVGVFHRSVSRRNAVSSCLTLFTLTSSRKIPLGEFFVTIGGIVSVTLSVPLRFLAKSVVVNHYHLPLLTQWGVRTFLPRPKAFAIVAGRLSDKESVGYYSIISGKEKGRLWPLSFFYFLLENIKCFLKLHIF